MACEVWVMGYCRPMSVFMQIPAHLGGPEAMGFRVLRVCYLRGGESMRTRNVGCIVGSRPAHCQLYLVMTIMHHINFPSSMGHIHRQQRPPKFGVNAILIIYLAPTPPLDDHSNADKHRHIIAPVPSSKITKVRPEG